MRHHSALLASGLCALGLVASSLVQPTDLTAAVPAPRAGASPATTASPASPTAASAAPAGRATTVHVLYSGNCIGTIEPCG